MQYRSNTATVLALIALVVAAMALFAAVWTVLPAPTYDLWLFSVGATEWSLYIGAVGLFAVGLGVTAFRLGARRRGGVAAVAGTLSVLLATLPFFEILPIARQSGAHLSLGEYTDLTPADAGDAPVAMRTVRYAIVEGQSLQLDAYRSSAVPLPTRQPALVVVHGGSWRQGDRSDFARWDRYLAAHGYAIFDIDYRVTPQPNWQSATNDIETAVRWVRRNAADVGVDPARIALLGRSAGGHLALLAAYSRIQPPVQAVVSLYGPTDLTWGYDHVAFPDVIDGRRTLRLFLGGIPSQMPMVYRDASPISYADHSLPPTLLFHGGRDRLVGPQHSEMLADRLIASGNVVEYVPIPYALHGFDYDFDGWGSQVVRPTLLHFLSDHLHAQ